MADRVADLKKKLTERLAGRIKTQPVTPEKFIGPVRPAEKGGTEFEQKVLAARPVAKPKKTLGQTLSELAVGMTVGRWATAAGGGEGVKDLPTELVSPRFNNKGKMVLPKPITEYAPEHREAIQQAERAVEEQGKAFTRSATDLAGVMTGFKMGKFNFGSPMASQVAAEQVAKNTALSTGKKLAITAGANALENAGFVTTQIGMEEGRLPTAGELGMAAGAGAIMSSAGFLAGRAFGKIKEAKTAVEFANQQKAANTVSRELLGLDPEAPVTTKSVKEAYTKAPKKTTEQKVSAKAARDFLLDQTKKQEALKAEFDNSQPLATDVKTRVKQMVEGKVEEVKPEAVVEPKVAEEPLLAQARKYKSEEEFEKALGKEYFVHGTKADFTKFDTSRISSGEGMVAYGKGMYVGDNIDFIHKNYATQYGEGKNPTLYLINKKGLNIITPEQSRTPEMWSRIATELNRGEFGKIPEAKDLSSRIKAALKEQAKNKDPYWDEDFLVELNWDNLDLYDVVMKKIGVDGIGDLSGKFGQNTGIVLFNPETLKFIKTSKSQLTSIYKEANKAVSVKPKSPLHAEASAKNADGTLKYKSAEEFVRNQKPIYFGGAEYNPARGKLAGTSFSTEKRVAEGFAKEYGTYGKTPHTVNERYLKPSAKVAQLEDIPDEFFIDKPGVLSGEVSVRKGIKKGTNYDNQVFDLEIPKWAKANGYDAIDLTRLPGKEAEFRVLNPDALQSKSQLTSIYNEAVKTAPKKAVPVKPQKVAEPKKAVKVVEKPVKKAVGVVPKEKVKVSRSQLPVESKEGKVKISRLEQRVKESLTNASDEVKDLSTYGEMNKPDQIADATKYVLKNTDEAIAVLQGDIPEPKGLLKNSIYVALHNLAIGDVDLATKLTTLSATRSGQELSILTELNPNSPVKWMTKLQERKIEVMGGNEKIKATRSSDIKATKNTVKESLPKKSDWQKFIEEIKCK